VPTHPFKRNEFGEPTPQNWVRPGVTSEYLGSKKRINPVNKEPPEIISVPKIMTSSQAMMMTPELAVFNEQNKQRLKNVVDLVTDEFTYKKVKTEKKNIKIIWIWIWIQVIKLYICLK
jgi:hypothetical protein